MSQRRQQLGFTLIEIMVVVIIVGVLASIAILSVGTVRDDRELRTEAHRFAALLGVALDEAAMQGREFGVEVLTAGYRFVEYDALSAQWSDVPGDDTLRLRSLPDELEFELYLEDKRILLDDDPAEFDDPEERRMRAATDIYSPHLLIYSSGDTNPFELHVYRPNDNARVVLRGDALGTVEIVHPDET
jgi:general secretion pathway protein H